MEDGKEKQEKSGREVGMDAKDTNMEKQPAPQPLGSEAVVMCPFSREDANATTAVFTLDQMDKRGAASSRNDKVEEKTAELTPAAALENKKKWAAITYKTKVDIRKMKKEFIANKPTKIESAVTDKNYDKCRYSDIPCIESTRVILKGRSPDKDFIHANWMTMPDGFRYISTQGPIGSTAKEKEKEKNEAAGSVETIEDFWHMIVTEKAENIVMICKYYEGTPPTRKCGDYLPTKKQKTFGPYTVALINKDQPVEDIQHTVVEVATKGSKDKHTVHHYQMLDWPDHETPYKTTSTVKLLKMLRVPTNINPIVVHCSAGIGRTATFIGLDYCTQRIAQNPNIDILETIREMRKMRARSVQSHDQYLFLIFCVTEMMLAEGVPRNDFMSRIPAYFASKDDKKKTVKEDKKSKGKK